MIVSKEVRELIEGQVSQYEKRMIDEKFLEATWALSKLLIITKALLTIQEV